MKTDEEKYSDFIDRMRKSLKDSISDVEETWKEFIRKEKQKQRFTKIKKIF